MSIPVDTVKDIANLCRLQFDETELQGFSTEFNQVLELIETINQVDTADITPMANPLEMTQRLRTDQISEDNQREQLMANAPNAEMGLFMVPKVVE